MAVRIKSITFDCTDPYRLAQFWSQLSGFVEDPSNGNAPGDPEAVLLSRDGSLALLFIAVPEPKRIKNRVHLDLVPLDRRRDEEVERLLGVGARLVADQRRPNGAGWVVLADPEGNELCIERSEVERSPQVEHLGRTTEAVPTAPRLRRGIVLGVAEDVCQVLGGDRLRSVRYSPQFPSPRTERVSPGHLVAVANGPDGSEVVSWRWYDAVVIGDESNLVRMWEPSHGEVLARRRDAQQHLPPGTRAYLSAGLPGADWWVAGTVVARTDDADVELDDVERFYNEHDLWKSLA